VLGVPLTDLCATRYTDPRERQLLKNIVYVGVLAAMLGVEPEVIATLLGEQYKGKAKLLQPNLDAFMMGLHHGREYFDDALGLRIERRDAVGKRIFIEGNAAAALGCVYGGATVCAWYPITPSSSLAEGFQKYCSKLRVDKATGKNKFAIVQAEDEIASIGIVVGAGWNGARGVHRHLRAGVSLMTEFIGLAYFAEIPVTIINVQRGGPSTGMPTRTQQADLLACAYASHGDTKHVLLFPEDPTECFDFSAAALDLADRLQTPIFVMTDLDIGMNHRLCEPLRVGRRAALRPRQGDDRRRARGGPRLRPLSRRRRRRHPLPHPPRHASEQGLVLHPRHDPRRLRALLGGGPDYLYNVTRLLKKFETAKELVPQPVLKKAARETRFGVIYYGSTSPAMAEAFDALQDEGVHVDILRDPGLPVQRRGRPLRRRARVGVRGRAEPRRPAAHDADQRAGDRAGEARADPALRRHADHGALHHRGDRQAGRADNVEPIPRQEEGKGRGMTYLAKPKLHHPTLPANKLGFTRRDYEGKISTLCAGCGHDSISAALVQACWELEIEPHRVAKLSGIGCSSKTPDYFLGASHGFNTVHGRMPSVLTGANLANRELLYLGVSGDGDSASIGLGQFAHAMRRGVNMTYIVENNGVYGLTKGQFSATADQGSKSKKGVVNSDTAIDLVAMALQLGASYVGRSFSATRSSWCRSSRARSAIAAPP
jgi:pyruvate/2-oxoacid:ferredoxin oxidoreductase alpha subunit